MQRGGEKGGLFKMQDWVSRRKVKSKRESRREIISSA